MHAGEFFNPSIELLIAKAEAQQWAIATALDWSLPVIVPPGVSPDDYIDMVSQLYHAEIVTIDLCARLIREVPDFQARRFLCTQLADEARHARAYALYIEKLGTLRPINGRLAAIFAKADEWSGSYCGLIVALNVLLEGEAINQQAKRIKTSPCPLFRALNSQIMRDESRHSAFGHLYMKEKLPALAPGERAQILAWSRRMRRSCKTTLLIPRE